MNKTSNHPAWLLLTVLLASCTAIVGSKLDKPRDVGGEAEAELELELDILPDEEATADEEDLAEEDAVEDTPVDVGPDFDPDACGVWGTVSIPDHEAVGIDTGDEDRDGHGSMQIMVLYPDSFIVDYLNLKVFPGDYAYLGFTLDGPNYYCIPEAFFTEDDIVDAWIIPFVLDGRTSEPEEPNDFLTFQGIIPDPLTLMIAAATYKDSEAINRNKSPLYWTDAAPDNSLPVNLERRASKFNGTIDFNGFLLDGTRNARVCITVYGERDPAWALYEDFPTEILGSNYLDLEDDTVEGNGTLDFSVDFAASPRQTFKVHLKYIENRNRTSVFSQCGDADVLASCAGQCYTLDDTVGVTFTAGATFAIDMVLVTDPGCTLDMANVCP